MGALFVAALDAYAVSTLLPGILADLSLSVERIQEASPIVGGFLVGYVSALPLFGAASDARGRVPAAVAALGVFAAGSVVTGAAGSLPVLVGGRALQGLGGGALVPLALAAAADLWPGGGRETALGWVSALQELGSVVGPVYGVVAALLLRGWRGVFLVDLPLAAVLAWLLWRAGPRAPVRATRRVDLVSAVLLGAGLALLAAALYPDAPEARALNSRWPVFGGLAVAMLAGFAARQRSALDWSPGVAGALLANGLVGAGLIVVLVDVPVFARAVLSVDQRSAGLLLTAFLAGVPVGAALGGWLAGRLGLRLVGAAGLVAAALGFFLLAAWGPRELNFGARPYLELAWLGFGFGLSAAPLAASALQGVPGARRGFVAGLVVAARTLGMVAGLSMLTAYGLHRVDQLVAARGAPPRGLTLHEQLRWIEDAAIAAFQQEFHEVFMGAAAVCVVAAAVAALTLSRRPAPSPAAPG